MKKILSFILIFISLFIVSCSNEEKDSIKLITDVNNLQIEISEKITINLSNNLGKLNYKLDNENIQVEKIDETEIVLEGLSKGKTKCIIYLEANEEIFVEFEVEVIENKFNFTASIEDIICGETKEIIVKYDELFNPDFEYSTTSENISLDGNKVTGLKEGSAIILIKDKVSNVQKELTLTIVKKNSLVFNCLDYVYVGFDVYLDCDDLSSDEESFTYTNKTSDIIAIVDGKITGLKEGTGIVDVCNTITGEEGTFKIKVRLSETVNEAYEYAYDNVKDRGFLEANLVFKNDKLNCKYEWISSNDSLFDSTDGTLDMPELNEVVTLTLKIIFDSETVERSWDYIVIGAAFGDISSNFENQFIGNKLFKDMSVISDWPDYYGGTVIKWSSSDESIFTNEGKFTKPLEDSFVTITYTIVLGNNLGEYTSSITLSADGRDIRDLSSDILTWIDNNFCTDNIISEETILPTYIDEYNVSLEWLDANNKPLKIENYAGNPVFSSGLNLKIKATYKGESTYISKHYDLEAKGYENKWDLIKVFTDTIAMQDVTTYKYSLVSWTGTENGYIPFYNSEKSAITVDILPYTYGHQRTNEKKKSTEYIVVHDTGNAKEGANAEMHNRYIKGLNEKEDSDYISWHFTVGDDGIYQHLPLDEVAYHAGDGSKVYGDVYFNETYQKQCIGGGNRNGIGIESCINLNVDYTFVMRRLAKLVAELLIDFNLTTDRVKQHYDFMGKNCPQVMRNNNRWEEFLVLVNLEYFAKTQLKDVSFEWIPKTDNLDSTGKVIKANLIGEKVAYDVKVTYQGETKTFSYENIIKSR